MNGNMSLYEAVKTLQQFSHTSLHHVFGWIKRQVHTRQGKEKPPDTPFTDASPNRVTKTKPDRLRNAVNCCLSGEIISELPISTSGLRLISNPYLVLTLEYHHFLGSINNSAPCLLEQDIENGALLGLYFYLRHRQMGKDSPFKGYEAFFKARIAALDKAVNALTEKQAHSLRISFGPTEPVGEQAVKDVLIVKDDIVNKVRTLWVRDDTRRVLKYCWHLGIPPDAANLRLTLDFFSAGDISSVIDTDTGMADIIREAEKTGWAVVRTSSAFVEKSELKNRLFEACCGSYLISKKSHQKYFGTGSVSSRSGAGKPRTGKPRQPEASAAGFQK